MDFVRLRKRFAWATALLIACMGCLSSGQELDIQSLIKCGNLEGMRWPDFSDYRNWLQKFYESSGFASIWVQGAQPVPRALGLIERFRDAAKKGLDPEDYDASRWEERIRALQSTGSGPAAAPFDVALTVRTMRYVSDALCL